MKEGLTFTASGRLSKEPEKKRKSVKAIKDFKTIQSEPVAYWASESVFENFSTLKTLDNYIDARSGISTGDNNLYYRCWFECDIEKIAFDYTQTPENSAYKWFPIIRGGDFRKWYGNMENVLNLENDGYAIKNSGNNFRLRTPAFYNKRGITWNRISSRAVSFRLKTEQVNFGENSPCMFLPEENILMTIGMLNSKVAKCFLEYINSTMTFQVLDIQSIPYLPVKDDSIERIVKECIELSKSEWDDYETSWDFTTHPFIKFNTDGDLSKTFTIWESYTQQRFDKVKENEEIVNRYFINAYNLSDEISPEVSEEDITMRLSDMETDVKSFLSYAVGCMFGRYSLDEEGTVYAGNEWQDASYITYIPDDDNVIPITDEGYVENDIVARFVSWLRVAFGEEKLEDNLTFIANALGKKGVAARDVIRNYFVNEFFKDHCQTYNVTSVGKRPIYWLFDSGKQNGFKALIYMHRYNADTIGNLRVDYLHRMERIYESEINRMQDTIDNSSNAREVTAATKRKEKLQKQLKECQEYDEKIGHLALSRIDIDLDDGVKVNYEKVQTASDGKKYQVLAKI